MIESIEKEFNSDEAIAVFTPICSRCHGTILTPYQVVNGMSIAEVNVREPFYNDTLNIKMLKAEKPALYYSYKGEPQTLLICPHCHAIIEKAIVPIYQYSKTIES